MSSITMRLLRWLALSALPASAQAKGLACLKVG
jgi:hypothetical protein